MPEENGIITRVRPVEKDYNAIWADEYGRPLPPIPEEQEMSAKISDMLQSQWKAASDQRTNAHKLAQVTALGNVLQNIFTPVAWGAGGHGKATSQPITPDNRAYISAFNEAIRADQNLANVGTQNKQTMLNYEMQKAARDRARREANADAAVERERRNFEKELNQYNTLEAIYARGDVRQNVENLRASLKQRYQLVGRGGKTPEQALAAAIYQKAAQKYFDDHSRWERGDWPEDKPEPNEGKYMADAASLYGYSVKALGGGNTGSNDDDNTPPSRKK